MNASSTSQSDRATAKRPPVLVLGLGNILLRDEGVGVRVIEHMLSLALPETTELFDGATAGLDLLDVLADRRKVIVIDALDGDVDPGTVMRLVPEDLSPTGGRLGNQSVGLSLHEVGLMETLEIGKRLGIKPDEVVIIGVKPQDTGCGLALSPQIAEVVPRIVDAVMTEIQP